MMLHETIPLSVLFLLRGGGLKQFWKFRWRGGGGSKTVPSVRGVRIFSGITQYLITCIFFFSSVLILFMAQSGARMPIKINNSL